MTARHAEYGITLEELAYLRQIKQGRCHCCDGPMSDRDENTEHDHETGDVRGLCCRSCNTRLGQLGDDIDGVVRLFARYLVYLTKRARDTQSLLRAFRLVRLHDELLAQSRWTKRCAFSLYSELGLSPQARWQVAQGEIENDCRRSDAGARRLIENRVRGALQDVFLLEEMEGAPFREAIGLSP